MPECVLPIFRLCPSVNDRLFYLCLRAVNAGLCWNLSYWLQTCLSVGLQYVLLSGRSFFFSNTQLDQTYCTVSVSTGTLPFVNVTAVAIHRTRRGGGVAVPGEDTTDLSIPRCEFSSGFWVHRGVFNSRVYLLPREN